MRSAAAAADVSPNELIETIAERIGARLERFARQEMLHVADERVHRRVTALRVLVHRGEAQDVQVGPLPATNEHTRGNRADRGGGH